MSTLHAHPQATENRRRETTADLIREAARMNDDAAQRIAALRAQEPQYVQKFLRLVFGARKRK